MSTIPKDKISEIIKNEYPDSNNKALAKKLGLSEVALRTRASKLGIKKSESYMKQYYINLQTNRKIKHQESYKDYNITNIEQNILIGSLLGDGTLSKYGRSLNACYRESTGIAQRPYRKWKVNKLKNLDFKIKADGSIYSPSHPLYTKLFEMFYPNGIKIIPEDGLKMLNHPIGLACLFMDDGSLVTSGSIGVNTITVTASIPIYSQSFSKEENIMLLDHIKNTYGISFRLAKIPNGFGYHLIVSRKNAVREFLNIVEPIINEIPSMKYKIDIDSKLKKTKESYQTRHPNKIVTIANTTPLNKFYLKEDELIIIKMINAGFSYKEIAKNINRTYDGLYDKIRRMKLEGKI